MFKELRISCGDLAVYLQTDMCPSANPVAIVQICMACVSITNIGFVITAPGADRTRPAGVAFHFALNVATFEKFCLCGAINTFRNVAEFVLVRIYESMAWRDIARRPDSQQSQSGAARVRFADAGVQLLQRVTDV